MGEALRSGPKETSPKKAKDAKDEVKELDKDQEKGANQKAWEKIKDDFRIKAGAVNIVQGDWIYFIDFFWNGSKKRAEGETVKVKKMSWKEYQEGKKGTGTSGISMELSYVDLAKVLEGGYRPVMMPDLKKVLDEGQNRLKIESVGSETVEKVLKKYRGKNFAEVDIPLPKKTPGNVINYLKKDLGDGLKGALNDVEAKKYAKIAGFKTIVFPFTILKVEVDNGVPPKIAVDPFKIDEWVQNNMVLNCDTGYSQLVSDYKNGKYKKYEEFVRATDSVLKKDLDPQNSPFGKYKATMGELKFQVYHIGKEDQRPTGPYDKLEEKILKENPGVKKLPR